MLESLQQHILWLDYQIWFKINVVWRSTFLDQLMPFVRNQYFWAPLYLFLLAYTTYNYKKIGWLWCIFFLITFGICDYTSASILKPIFERTRPCNNPYLSEVVQLIVPRSSGLSFPSSHASNHFGLAMFMSMTLGAGYRWVWIAAMFWAALVSYAQVYVGVHFPLDIFVGALLGVLVGWLTGNVFNRLTKFPVLMRAQSV